MKQPGGGEGGMKQPGGGEGGQLSNPGINIYFGIWFFSINTYLKLEILVVCRDFLAFKYMVFFRFFETNQMIIYIRTSEILKTCVWNRFFGTQYPFIFGLVGREY